MPVGDSKQLAQELQQSVNDPRPSLPHDEVMARMKARIARHSAAKAKAKVAKSGSVPPNRRRRDV